MSSYLVRVKKKMTSYAMRQSRGVFAGNLGSILKGRSMDFDELREYNYGDDAKDIDWKASARSRNIMVRRYIAIRKHNILIVADNSRSMAALSPSGESKADVAAFCGAVIASIALRHNDLIGLVAGNHEDNQRFPMREELAYVENFLDKYYKSVSPSSPTPDMNALLSYVTKAFREQMFIVIITDPSSALKIDRNILRKLNARHEQMFCIVNDANLSDKKLKNSDLCDIEHQLRIPRYIRANKSLRKAEERYRIAQQSCIRKVLHHYGIVSCFVDGSDNAIPQIIKMLGDQKNAKNFR